MTQTSATKVVKFSILGGGDALVGDLGSENLWLLKIGGALIPLNERSEWDISIDPMPHAWRIGFTLKNGKPSPLVWFDVLEEDAMNIERLVGENT